MDPPGSTWNPPGIIQFHLVPPGSNWFRSEPVGHSKVLQVSDSDSDDDDEACAGFEDWKTEETDWFSDVPNDDEKDVVAEWDTDTVKDLEDASGETLVTTDSSKLTHRVDLYDSGCTNHISPFREQFENYVNILLKRF